jgi:hypothetical protein
MKGCIKRVLGLLLVLSTGAWSQAVCPMMLFPQTAESCGIQPNKTSASAHHQKAEHDCCPRARRSRQQDESAKLSACSSGMSCCTVERKPASAPKTGQTSTAEIAVVGRVMASELYVMSPAQLLEAADESVPIRGVLSRKEDLRI